MSSRPATASIIFFGNERLATGVTTTAPTLRALIAAGYDIKAVVSHHSGTRSRTARSLEIADIADKHGIPVLLPDRPADIEQTLQSMGADIGVLAAYGRIVPESVINLFPRGIVNIHPSLLPLHRGPTPVESVILDGAYETGVSIMQLVRAMDAGPVYGQLRVALTATENKHELAERLLQTGSELLIKLLPDILSGTLQPLPQDETLATYDQLITKEAAMLDFGKSAERLVREVRAYAGWPQSRLNIGDTTVIVTQAHMGKTSENRLSFPTTDGYFVIDRLKPAGKSEMSAEAFLAGYGEKLGI